MSLLHNSTLSFTWFAKDNQKLLVIAGGILAFLIYNLKTHSINKKNDGSGVKEAPLVKYTIPWLGSAIELGRNPDNLFRKAVKTLGPVFRVQAAGREITYITSPDLISTVYRDSKTYHFVPIRLDMTEKVFGSSRSVCRDPVYFEDMYKLHHDALSPVNINIILQRYTTFAYETLQKTLSDNMGVNNDSTITTTIKLSFVKPVIYEASLYAFFGKQFSASESYDLFNTFDDGFLLLHTKLPHFVLKKTIQAREKLIQLFEKYLSGPHDDCSEMITGIEQISNKTNWSLRDKAVIFLGDLWALQSNAPQAAYWLITLQLQRPEGFTNLIQEIDTARAEWFKSNDETLCNNDFQWILDSPLPLLTSTIQETLRFTSYSFSIRLVKNDTVLGGYHIPEGNHVVCNTRLVHMDEDVHENCRDYLPDRYVKNTKFAKEGRSVPNHSMPFGGGVSMCEGRHFALGELKIFIALLLTLVTIEIDPTSSERPRFNYAHMGTGIVPPTGDLSVRVTKRNL